MDLSMFSFSSFISMMLPLVLAPTLLGVGVIWMITHFTRSSHVTMELPAGGASQSWVGWFSRLRLGVWMTGLIGAVLGLLTFIGWLSWSGPNKGGGFYGPSLPMPHSFPVWQVVACGVTTVGLALLTSLCCRRLVPGALAAALGTGAGFSAGFALGAANEVTSQEAVGVLLSMMFVPFSLGVVTGTVALVRAERIREKRL
ncbi:hypothetical protein [Corynebacterium sp. A21]|uniref:hypothetical protein n=1 Tax=Corynebacterium sp. A21 TaxID=3457318 RepID=UPI003FD28815